MNKRTKELVREAVRSDDGIESIYEIKTPELTVCLMHVNRHTSKGDFLPFYFDHENSMEAVVEVHPDDLKILLSGATVPENLAMPGEWALGECVFDGELQYDDFNEMITDIKGFSYQVGYFESPMRRLFGFKCPYPNRSWVIGIFKAVRTAPSYMRETLKTPAGRRSLLHDLNMKPVCPIPLPDSSPSTPSIA